MVTGAAARWGRSSGRTTNDTPATSSAVVRMTAATPESPVAVTERAVRVRMGSIVSVSRVAGRASGDRWPRETMGTRAWSGSRSHRA